MMANIANKVVLFTHPIPRLDKSPVARLGGCHDAFVGDRPISTHAKQTGSAVFDHVGRDKPNTSTNLVKKVHFVILTQPFTLELPLVGVLGEKGIA